MLEREMKTLADGPRELIARLAAAVMIADGRITEPEIRAVDHLHALGLGPLSAFVDAEIRRAMRAPIDVPGTASALVELAPNGGALVVAALAHIAASDRDLSPRELEVMSAVADTFGLAAAEVAQVIDAAMKSGDAATAPPAAPVAGEGARIGPARPPELPPAPEPALAAPPPSRAARGLDWALPVLGLPAGASIDETDAAYSDLIRRYNPGAVVDLGPEFAVLAVQKLNRITAAYVTARAALTAG